MTKKGRPGYILLIDVDPKLESEAVEALSKYLPIFGYHRFNTQHVFRKGSSGIAKVVVKSDEGVIEAQVRYRSMPSDRRDGRSFIESDDIVDLHRRVKKELGVDVSPLELKQKIDPLLLKSESGCVEVEV